MENAIKIIAMILLWPLLVALGVSGSELRKIFGLNEGN